jgi:hypothetical protein
MTEVFALVYMKCEVSNWKFRVFNYGCCNKHTSACNCSGSKDGFQISLSWITYGKKSKFKL